MSDSSDPTPGARAKIEVRGLRVHYGDRVALDVPALDVFAGEILAVIGPAGAGKSTLLKCINRMSDMTPDMRVEGTIRIDGEDVREMSDVAALRRRIGVVFPLPVGLPMSIYDNVAFAPRMAGIRKRAVLDELVERCLRQSALFDEVKDRMNDLGTRLSGGQQQRLTIARALSLEPEILCLDEFSIAVDPVTTMRIEEVIKELSQKMTVILVTNLVLQARRLGDRTALFLDGRLIEVGPTDTIFSRNARDARTYQFVEGLFG